MTRDPVAEGVTLGVTRALARSLAPIKAEFDWLRAENAKLSAELAALRREIDEGKYS